MNDVGRRGEMIAEQYLRDRGFQIIARNWSDGAGVHCRGEIDLVAIKDDTVHFVEVKCRANDQDSGDFAPESAYNKTKVERLKKAALTFTKLNKIQQESRFTLIAINLSPNAAPQIRLYEDVNI